MHLRSELSQDLVCIARDFRVDDTAKDYSILPHATPYALQLTASATRCNTLQKRVSPGILPRTLFVVRETSAFTTPATHCTHCNIHCTTLRHIAT
mmetsp:Transcript_77950/g.114095  ORF Transcript_77950/g.114095 Transcript_77950/m.114095 type:complete len:95 (+) Transcript_77950:2809-3093(+)